MNLQSRYDLDVARDALEDQLEQQVQPYAAG
jgi:plasmid maintenance system antidote protein VapI